MAVLTPTFAQDNDIDEEQVLLADSSRIGFNVGVRVAFGVADRHRLMGEFGIDMGVIVNKYLEAGVFFAGLYSGSKFDYELNNDYMLSAFYGGVYVQPIFFANKRLHLSVPVRMAAGNINYETPDYYSDSYKVAKVNGARECSAALIVFEPGLQMQIQTNRYIQIAVGVSYRDCLTGLEYQKTEKKILNNSEINHLHYALTLRFGKF